MLLVLDGSSKDVEKRTIRLKSKYAKNQIEFIGSSKTGGYVVKRKSN
nr:hypothetical protein [Sulfurimonas sp. SAG-AH-194-C21]